MPCNCSKDSEETKIMYSSTLIIDLSNVWSLKINQETNNGIKWGSNRSKLILQTRRRMIRVYFVLM